MSRLGRDEQRDHEGAGCSADRAATPIDVRVPAAGAGARSASVDGATVVAAPGEEIQNAVLNHLHRLALAAGQPVLATIHDRRVGYSVPLRVDPDGASHLAADPVPAPAEEEPAVPAATPVPEETPVPERAATGWDRPTHVLRSLEAVPDGAPAFPSPAVPDERRTPAAGSAPTFVLRALPEPAGGVRPGTVAPPTGVFGPPPRMGDAAAVPVPEGAVPAPEEAAPRTASPADPEPAHTRAPEPPREPAPAQPHELTARPEPSSCPTPLPEPTPLPDPAAAPKPVTASKRPSAPGPFLDADPGPKPTPTPARGFDAVAEAVLGDALLTVPGDATTAALLAEPTARINEAVREGRTQTAAHLAEQVVTDASRTLGPEHPEVLRLRELTAYIAYLSGDPGRAFDLSLELARLHRRAGDAEAAYGNVQSAATAWRAVRDPEQGLELGRDLVGLWDELAAEEGPAAEDAEELESVRTRMGRLAERLRTRAG
ncbi:hypothetical protein [Streptomyces olivaceus]|uniref:hypothetical protein n=1 Tax=Streptomyces olivaceus TaxID=47716 RepID=UPI0004CAFE3F|nr:hypothetical protein [Streptomyces olivaceus]MBZ6107358.1 tetratricopeptide repeat protein [Streptomyces olivaceus]